MNSKKLRRNGTIILLISLCLLLLLSLRLNDKMDTLNAILLVAIAVCTTTGAIFRWKEISRRRKEIENNIIR